MYKTSPGIDINKISIYYLLLHENPQLGLQVRDTFYPISENILTTLSNSGASW